MSRHFYVFDSGALMAFAHGVDAVGQILTYLAETDFDATVAVPSTCLLEAYSLLDHDEHDMLRILRRNPVVRIEALVADVERGDELPFVGGMARLAGRLGAGHAAYVAATGPAAVVTSRADQIRAVLGEDWDITEV